MGTGDYLIIAILFLAGAIAFLIFVPKRQVRHVEKLEERIALETEIRKTLAQILGGIILLGGLFFTWGLLRTTQQAREMYDAIATLFQHALVVALFQAVFLALVAYFLTERWQRWRQRREFQYRSLVKFSELSEEAFNRLSEMLMLTWRLVRSEASPFVVRPKISEMQREFVDGRARLLAMDGELGAGFKDPKILQGLIYLRDIMRILYGMVSKGFALKSQFEPVQQCMAQQRKVMITRMARGMGLLSKREARHALEELEPQAKLPPGVVPPAEDEAEG